MATQQAMIFEGVECLEDLASFLGIPLQKLTMLAFAPGIKRYKPRAIPKKTGGLRTVSIPRGDLKAIQRKIAKELSESYEPPKCVHGFVEQKSVASNANMHTRKRFLLTVDLEDFFTSIRSGRVHQLFLKYYRLNLEVTNALTNLVCYKGCLPQGAPTSPIISNIICYKMDRAFLNLASSIKFDYTRYADDLTFSTTSAYIAKQLFDVDKVGVEGINPRILRIIHKNYFKVNEKKVHVAWKGSRQLVNGIVVNEKCNMKRETYRKFRSLFYVWGREGYEAAVEKYLTGDPIYRDRLVIDGQICGEKVFAHHIRGRLEYLTMVITSDGKTNGPIEKLWTMYSDQTEERVPFVIPDRYAIRLESCYDEGKDLPAIAGGTGFRVDNTLITCAHCLPKQKGAGDIEVVLRFRTGKASLSICQFTVMEGFDLAWTSFSDKQVPPIGRVNLYYLPQKNETVLAIGYPDGGSQYSVTANVLGTAPDGCGIMVDRPFIKGMSGGPVLNLRHELIGIVSKGSDGNSYTRDGEFIPLVRYADIAPMNLWRS
ncbi:MAG: reverse transcriptase domain-containing protein [Coriobacteriales bacterium]|nr:reverse transcriptase domain-containing protein [Coriobacteriales bacterium]